MIRTELCDWLGIRYPIIQAGMGPFGTNRLSIAAANAGVLGLVSASGIASRLTHPGIHKHFVETGGASVDDDDKTALKKIFRQTLERTRAQRGIFGVNMLVSEEMRPWAETTLEAIVEARNEDPEMRERLRVFVTSAGDPLPWSDRVKKEGLAWIHVVPSVKAALRCKKAGVDCVVASGHEGGFHTAWEPVHSMVLLPAVVDAMAGSGVRVIGAGGFCDGRTLVAAIVLGACGIQMGTRFLATQESDFHPMWKQGVVNAGDRGTLVARGFVGPARWLKTPVSTKHQEKTLRMSPGVFLGVPDDYTTVPSELLEAEHDAMNAVYAGDETRALLAGGECSQRINDLPEVDDLVQRIVGEAEETLAKLPQRFS